MKHRAPHRSAAIRGLALSVVCAATLGGCSDGIVEPREDKPQARIAALEVRHKAIAVAEAMARQAPDGCGFANLEARIGRWKTFTSHVEVTVEEVVPEPSQVLSAEEIERLAGTVELSPELLGDTRPPVLDLLVKVRRDAAGNLALTEITRYALDGDVGERSRELRQRGDRWQVREDALPFVDTARVAGEAQLDEALGAWERTLVGLGPVAFEPGTELAAAGTATTAPPTLIAPLPEGARAACPQPPGMPRLWLDDLGDDWVVEDLRATFAEPERGLPTRRALTATLRLDDGRPGHDPWASTGDVPERRLRVTIRETSTVGTANAVVAATDVLPATVDRSYWHARLQLDGIWTRALVPDFLRQ